MVFALPGKGGARDAHEFVERGIGQSVARRFEAHDGIARAESQTIARRDGDTAGRQLPRELLRQHLLRRGEQRAAFSLGVATRPDADEETNGSSVHEGAQ